jgi:RimJ/RimL family protein N-acetyltransferase
MMSACSLGGTTILMLQQLWVGVAAQAMRAAVARVVEHHGANAVVIDPQVTNRRAITFYGRLGFDAVGLRDFDGDRCLVMRLALP